jgi:hypothetical protein
MITPNPIFCIFLYLSQFKFKWQVQIPLDWA